MRSLLILCGAIVLCDTMFFAALTPLLPEYADEFDLSKTGAGALQAAYPLGVLVGSIPSGYAAARFGVKPTAVMALLVIAGTSAIFGYADSIVVLDTARFLQGIGSAFAWTAALAWLIAVAPAGRRGQLIGTVLGVAIAGALLGPVLGGIASVLGTGPVFSAVGVVAIGVAVAALLMAHTAEGRPGSRSPPCGAPSTTGASSAASGSSRCPPCCSGRSPCSCRCGCPTSGSQPRPSAPSSSSPGRSRQFCLPVVGRLADRRGKRYPIIIGLVASAIATVALPWPQHGAVLAVVTVLAACAFGIFWAPAMSLVSDTSERIGLDVAWGFAIANLAWAPGQATGAAVGGTLARATTDAVPYLLLAGCCLATLAMVRSA